MAECSSKFTLLFSHSDGILAEYKMTQLETAFLRLLTARSGYVARFLPMECK